MNLEIKAKRVLVYGDSITYGRKPKPLERFDVNHRWTGILQKELGSDYEIIEEGLRARMLLGDNPHFKERDGCTQFGPILGSHLPVDLVVIFLGTNDLNKASNKSPDQIADGLDGYFKKIDWWVKEIKITQPPKVLIVSPPYVNEAVLKAGTIFKGAEAKSKHLAKYLKVKAEKYGAFFIDAALLTEPSLTDGVHLDEEGNSKLGKALAPVIEQILG